MTQEEMLNRVQARTGEHDTALLSAYIEEAGAIIIAKAYPFKSDITEVPLKYHYKQVEIAVYLVNKRGAEGQTMHIENGIHRTYEAASVPKSMLRDIVPLGKIPTSEVADENA